MTPNQPSPQKAELKLCPASELEVVFTTMPPDYRPSPVSEYVVMPSGDIVVLIDDPERGRESLWFNSKGQHPKSVLRRKGYAGNPKYLPRP